MATRTEPMRIAPYLLPAVQLTDQPAGVSPPRRHLYDPLGGCARAPRPTAAPRRSARSASGLPARPTPGRAAAARGCSCRPAPGSWSGPARTPSSRSSSRVRRPSRIRSRMSARVWPKKAKCTPNPSSSQAAGPAWESRSCKPLLAVGGQPVDDLRPAAGQRLRGGRAAPSSAIRPCASSSFRHGYSDP